MRIHLTILASLAVTALWAAQAAAQDERPYVPVTVQPLSELVIQQTWEAPATAVALNDARLSAEVAGRVVSIKVRVGDVVEQGELVAELDCQVYQTAHKRAEALHLAAVAQEEYAEARLENAERLAENRSIATEELDQRRLEAKRSRAETERAAAELTAAGQDVSKCALKSPFRGVVVERLANEGDYAVPATPVVRLLDEENIEVSARIQEQDLAGLQRAAQLTFRALNREYPLRPRVVIPLLQSVTRSYEARLAFEGEAAPPGAAGRLTWTDGEGYVPAHLLVRRGDALGVFLADGDRARFHAIHGAREGQPARNDLSEETSVIVDGRYALVDGDPIQRSEDPPAALGTTAPPGSAADGIQSSVLAPPG